MKVDVKSELIDLDGKEIHKNETEFLSVGDVIKACLSTQLEGDDKDTGDVRIRKFDIADSIYKSKDGKVDLQAQDISILKERILKVYTHPVIYKRMCDAFGEKN